MAISERFSNGQAMITAMTVGDVIAELSLLPADTPVRQGYNFGCDITLFNAGAHDAHIEFVEQDEADDEDEWCDDPDPRDDGGSL